MQWEGEKSQEDSSSEERVYLKRIQLNFIYIASNLSYVTQTPKASRIHPLGDFNV